MHKYYSDAIKCKREYEMACFTSEKYRLIEERFCAAHPQPASPDPLQEIGCWRDRVAFCAEAERAAEAAQLKCKAEQVHMALVGQQEANAEFEISSDAEALAGVKLFLQRSLEDAAERLRRYIASPSSPQGGWDLLNYALPVAFNTRRNLIFTCICSPESHFQFHSSLIPSQRRHGLFEPLFCRSVSVLQPMFQLPDVDTSNPQGVADIELALGSSLFDAMAHLVALSSVSLHDDIENRLRPSAVQHCIDLAESGMNASVISDDLFVGRVEEIGKINRCMGPVFQGVEEHCVLVLVHGIPGSGKSSLAKRQLELLQKQTNPHNVLCHIIQSRGRGAVRDGLHQMGLALATRLNFGTDASVKNVLDCLNMFLRNQRFIILADDADADALDELLRHVPPSSNPTHTPNLSKNQSTIFLRAL